MSDTSGGSFVQPHLNISNVALVKDLFTEGLWTRPYITIYTWKAPGMLRRATLPAAAHRVIVIGVFWQTTLRGTAHRNKLNSDSGGSLGEPSARRTMRIRFFPGAWSLQLRLWAAAGLEVALRCCFFGFWDVFVSTASATLGFPWGHMGPP